MAKRTFYEHFEFSMNSVGLTAPKSLFETQATAIATVSTIVAVVDKFGKAVTVAELVGAGALAEQLVVVGSCGAAFYAGACIGALIYASSQIASEHFWSKGENVSIKSLQSKASRLGIKASGKTMVAAKHHVSTMKHIA